MTPSGKLHPGHFAHLCQFLCYQRYFSFVIGVNISVTFDLRFTTRYHQATKSDTTAITGIATSIQWVWDILTLPNDCDRDADIAFEGVPIKVAIPTMLAE
jgi:hypothetical protein